MAQLKELSDWVQKTLNNWETSRNLPSEVFTWDVYRLYELYEAILEREGEKDLLCDIGFIMVN